MTVTYLPPVDRLLRLGAEPARRRIWPDYRTLGLEDRHVPALVRMATDEALHAAEERDRASWAPVHAWRALGQLRAEAAAEPLLALLERRIDSNRVYEELPLVLGMIGPAALPTATLRLFDEGLGDDVRVMACGIITGVGLEYPERADEAAAVLKTQLQDWEHQSPWLNANLIGGLAGLQRTDAAPLMEAAFAAGAVDVFICGDWEDVQVDLGLLPDRLTPPPRASDARAQEAARRTAARAKQRRKTEKHARKRNRGK